MASTSSSLPSIWPMRRSPTCTETRCYCRVTEHITGAVIAKVMPPWTMNFAIAVLWTVRTVWPRAHPYPWSSIGSHLHSMGLASATFSYQGPPKPSTCRIWRVFTSLQSTRAILLQTPLSVGKPVLLQAPLSRTVLWTVRPRAIRHACQLVQRPGVDSRAVYYV